jgi:peptidyl-prolyl cis-trans isomerase D
MANDSGKKPVLHKKHVARLQREQQQSRAILFAFIGILVVVALLLLYGYLDINYFQLRQPVATVGGNEILVNQFQPRVRLQRQQILAQYNQYQQYQQLFGMDVTNQLSQLEAQLNAPTDIGQTVLDQMVNEQLIRLEAEKRGITISDAELSAVKEEAFNYFPSGSPTPSVTPTEVTLPEVPAEAYTIVTITPLPSATSEATATLENAPTATQAPTSTSTPTLEPTATAGPTSTPEPTATPYTLEGFQTQFKDAQGRLAALGLSEKDYLAFFEIQLLEKKLTEELTANVPHTEKQVWARHILVADEATATSVIERLKNGEDFAALAKELSTDTGSAVNGGDLGWFGSGQMVAEFEAAAFALEKPGDYTTTPVQSSFGFHIIQLIAKQDRPLTADQYAAAKNKVFTDWLASAKETYKVEISDIWQQYVPTEPSFISIATDMVRTATAEAKKATKTPKVTPTP